MKIVVSFDYGSYDSFGRETLRLEYESTEQFIVDLENLHNEAKEQYTA